MRHAMLGVGGVGGLLGAALARAGEDVVLLMRPESLQAYTGVLQVQSQVLGDFEVAVPAWAELSEPVDVLWVSPKATHLEPALRVAPPEVVGAARVVSLLNGVDHLAVLQQRYQHVIGGAIRVESERLAPGQIRQSSPFIRVELAEGSDLVAALVAAGVDASLGIDAPSILWQKLAFLAPLALTTTAYGEPLGPARDRPEFQGCQAEAVAVAQAEGASLDLDALQQLTSGAPAGMRSSMQKDHEKGLALELDAIAGPIVRGGARHGIPTPATQRLTALIEATG